MIEHYTTDVSTTAFPGIQYVNLVPQLKIGTLSKKKTFTIHLTGGFVIRFLCYVAKVPNWRTPLLTMRRMGGIPRPRRAAPAPRASSRGGTPPSRREPGWRSGGCCGWSEASAALHRYIKHFTTRLHK